MAITFAPIPIRGSQRERVAFGRPEQFDKNFKMEAGFKGIAPSVLSDYIFNCCGLVGLEGMSPSLDTEDWPEWIAGLYRFARARGHIMYCLTSGQERVRAARHEALLSIGSRKLGEFPNLNHGPNMLQIWVVNIREAVNIYVDTQGNVLPKWKADLTPSTEVATPPAIPVLTVVVRRQNLPITKPERDRLGRFIKKDK
jgi:hypothetical protein